MREIAEGVSVASGPDLEVLLLPEPLYLWDDAARRLTGGACGRGKIGSAHRPADNIDPAERANHPVLAL